MQELLSGAFLFKNVICVINGRICFWLFSVLFSQTSHKRFNINEDDSKHKVIPSGEVQIKMKNTVTKIYHVICMLLPLPGNVWSSPNTLG